MMRSSVTSQVPSEAVNFPAPKAGRESVMLVLDEVHCQLEVSIRATLDPSLTVKIDHDFDPYEDQCWIGVAVQQGRRIGVCIDVEWDLDASEASATVTTSTWLDRKMFGVAIAAGAGVGVVAYLMSWGSFSSWGAWDFLPHVVIGVVVGVIGVVVGDKVTKTVRPILHGGTKKNDEQIKREISHLVLPILDAAFASSCARMDIRDVLMSLWDPMDVEGIPAEVAAYDDFIGDLSDLLSKRPSDNQIVDHLRCIEQDRLALRGQPDTKLTRVAKKLLSLGRLPDDER